MYLKKYLHRWTTLTLMKKELRRGRCPVCTLRLDSQYHTGCPFKEEWDREQEAKNLSTSLLSEPTGEQ